MTAVFHILEKPHNRHHTPLVIQKRIRRLVTENNQTQEQECEA